MTENLSNMRIEADTYFQEAQRTPIRLNLKRPHRIIIIKLSKVKDKERILEAPNENQPLQHIRKLP